MKGIILVGGEGTRLRPLTSRLPKPMVPIANRPLMERMIDWIRGHGITDIVLAMGYLPDQIRDYFGDGSRAGVNLTYVVENSPLGTAGAVKNAAGHLTSTCFVFNGDILTDLDLGAMLRAHRAANAQISISLTPVEDPTQFGVVEFDTDNRVERFTEKPKREEVRSNLINAGTYILEPRVLDYVPNGQFSMFERELFPQRVAAGDTVLAYPSTAYWIDIGTPDKYLAVHRDLLTGAVHVDLGTQRRPGVWANDSAIIEATAAIEGSAVLGACSKVGAGATLIGPVVLGPGAVVGEGATVQNSVLWDNVHIHSGAVVRNTILASGVSIAGECTDAVIGADVTVEPGNQLARGVRIWPGRVIPGDTISFG